MTWLLIEMLRDAPTVVAEDTRPRAWVAAERAVSQVSKDRTLWPRLRNEIEQLATEYQARQRSDTQVQLTVDAARHRHTLVIVPALGPGRIMHGAWVQVGRTDDPRELPEPPKTVAFHWNNTTRFLRGRGDLGVLSDPPPARPLTSTEIFESISVPDDLELIREILLDSSSGSWDGVVEVRGSGATGRVVMAADPADPETWRGLLYETTTLGTKRTSLEAAALNAMQRWIPDRYFVLVDLQRFRVLRWVTRPLETVQWKGQVDNRDAPHPDDVQRLFALAAKAMTGEIREGSLDGVRLRARGGGWVVVNGSAVLSGGTDRPSFALIQITVVGHSDEPDPVPVTDTGHPGLS